MTIVIHPDLAQAIVDQWLAEHDLTTIPRERHHELTSPELQRRGDLIDELRKHLAARDRQIDDLQAALIAECARTHNLDQLLQQRDQLIADIHGTITLTGQPDPKGEADELGWITIHDRPTQQETPALPPERHSTGLNPPQHPKTPETPQ